MIIGVYFSSMPKFMMFGIVCKWDPLTLILSFLNSCRDGDGAIIRPVPKPKRLLSEATNLPHIVQVSFPSISCLILLQKFPLE